MAIEQPEVGQIDLGRSRIRPADTYAPAARPESDGGGASLGNALASLGSQFESLGSEWKANQEKAQLGQIEYTANSIRGELKEGIPFDTQIGARLPEASNTVRMRVSESLGFDAGNAWVTSELDKIHSDQQLRLNKEALDARIADIRKNAQTNIQGSPFFGTGYLKAVEQGITAANNGATAERSKFYDIAQTKEYIRQNEANIKADQDNPANTTISHEAIGHDPSSVPNLRGLTVRASEGAASIDNLNSTFAKRLDKMVADMPPELRAKVTLDSAFRSEGHQRSIFAEELAKHGGNVREARKWAALPGHSMHNHGEAVDLGGVKDNPDVKAWVHGHAREYGLYFPMGHEPWHIEAIGGRRDQGGAKNGSGAKVDGPSASQSYGSPSSRVVDHIIGAESGGNPNARNPNSTASGLGQFTNGTWAASMRSFRPDLAMGKSDAQLAAMKSDPVLGREILTKFTEANAEKLKSGGMPVNEANLYLMHFAGEGSGPKVIKAADGTRIEDVMDPDQIAANPFLKGKTVAEVKQWAADKMGQPVSATMRAQNITRATDREWGRSSSLGNLARSEALVDYYTKTAVMTGDRSVLNRIPPEFITPDYQARIDHAAAQADNVKFTQFEHQQTMLAAQRKEDTRSLIANMDQKMVSGGTIDPARDAIGRDGTINHEAFEYAKAQRETNLALPSYVSAGNKAAFQDNLMMAAATNDWSKLDPSFAGQTPKMDQLRDYLSARRDLLSSDKVELQGKLDDIMEGAALTNSPKATAAFTQVSNYAKTIQASTLTGGKLAQQYKVNYESEAKAVFDAEVRTSTLAAMEDGKIPRGEAARVMYERAANKAQQHVDRLMTLMEKGDQGAIDKEKKLGKEVGYTTFKRADGVIEIKAAGGPSVPPQAGPLPVSAAAPPRNPVDVGSAAAAVAGDNPAGAETAASVVPPEAPIDRSQASAIAQSKPMGQSKSDPNFSDGAIIKRGVSALASIGSKIGDFLSGDPDQIIAEIKSGKGPVKADSPLGKRILAHQTERSVAQAKHKKFMDDLLNHNQ